MHSAYIVVDLGFGDAGKGATVDWLAARGGEGGVVVRFNGGPQAGHNVVTPEGQHHTFSQLGAGSFVAGVETLLPSCVHLHPLALLSEEAHLRTQGVEDALERLRVERETPLVTPFHQATQRLRELARGDGRHGSCGTGFGESVALTLEAPEEALTAGDLDDPAALRRKLRRGQEKARAEVQGVRAMLGGLAPGRRELELLDDPDSAEGVADAFGDFGRRVRCVDAGWLQRRITEPGALIFEGAQGVLLDEWHGFHPHTTWSTTTFANADALLDRAGFAGRRVRLGLTRAYGTRHGPGPFPTEHEPLGAQLPDPHNGHNPWQLGFRVGWLDLPLLRYALAVTGPVDALVVNHLDRVARLPAWSLAEAWQLAAAPDPAQVIADPCEPRRVLSLRPAWDHDLVRQERLTRLAEQATPQLMEITCAAPADAGPLERTRPLLDALEAHLGAPVALAATGPSRADRHLLNGAAHHPLALG